MKSMRRSLFFCVSAAALLTVIDGCGSSSTSTQAGGSDSGLPQCLSTQKCVQNSSQGRACLPACDVDGGGCPTGTICTHTSGCCIGTACSAISVAVCCAPSGC